MLERIPHSHGAQKRGPMRLNHEVRRAKMRPKMAQMCEGGGCEKASAQKPMAGDCRIGGAGASHQSVSLCIAGVLIQCFLWWYSVALGLQALQVLQVRAAQVHEGTSGTQMEGPATRAGCTKKAAVPQMTQYRVRAATWLRPRSTPGGCCASEVLGTWSMYVTTAAVQAGMS
ncbi:uncharacterized protein TRIVIDRAFT_62359 [Trichoderma virens Gv29-8]|uniref:Uncharacterized protein n=1 Tax=Hypocrea virens (strain Gv29-8 / FGSC 10586) TaxID=413071 RepID=G9MJM9_HYPVG|nr:uncharacterized protein TRIVIDRAFT_62359 [Trichoderma virens Gv29-8]EHK25692.1 hypothetical protein TRIVIDRAFT_62359 [Trichoderma virens Gv29-8]UKZ48490.1 hypothetical protein TrVGV298_002715 [Trichoderma virens]